MNHPVRLKHNSEFVVFFQALAGFVIAALVMVGVGGTVYKMIAPGGWFAQIFGRSLAGGMAALLALAMIGLSIWLTRAWVSVTSRNRYSALFVYLFAGAGLLYAVQMLMKGGV
jgi:hypothetical protein